MVTTIRKELKEAAKQVTAEDLEERIQNSKRATEQQSRAATAASVPEPTDDDPPGIDDRKALETDAAEVRKNLKSLFRKGNKAVDKIVDGIDDDESKKPVNIEALSQLIKALVSVNKEIMLTHESKHKILNPGGTRPTEPNTEGEGENEKLVVSSKDINKLVDNHIKESSEQSS